ncbi:MAG: branched-chain amino acid ABC transporter permease [Xanthobacteraceae bacterium]|jgi:branched-chain amino acid transport system permease protein
MSTTTILLQALLNGVASGSIYALIALGLSLQFGVMKIINFAHGSLLMIGMYLAVWATRVLGVHVLVMIPIVTVVLFVIGFFIQRWLIEPIYRKEATREPLGVLIFTTGLWIFLDNMMLILAGPDYQSLSGPWANQVVIFGNLIFSYPQIAAFVIATLVSGALVLTLRSTRIGRIIRATGQDREAASVLGIDSAKIYQLSFALGLTPLGVAGCLLLPLYPVNPFVGDVFGLRAFVVVVLGGMGSIGGAFWGGILVGIMESVGAQLMPVLVTEALIFAVFLAVLYVRPAGLFGLEHE